VTLLTPLALAALLTPQAPDPKPAFEVASIRPSPLQPFQVKTSPGRLLITGASLSSLIQEAYGVSAPQVVGVGFPDLFTIEAKAEGSATRVGLLTMLQTLLTERFKLEMHREMREMPVAALILRKNAWKGTPAAVQDADPALALRANREAKSVYLVGENVTLPFVAQHVSGRLNRFVTDSTGLEGAFDFKVEVPIDVPRAADLSIPERQVMEEMVTDLLEKLGLKVETHRAEMEVIVVDHAEQPSAN
jgi:uncharacterized protein (TIGR03435 family)